jgi:hypothetical protein
MNFLLLFSACAFFGPRAALTDGITALNDGNLQAFEEVVVLETVLPDAAEGCARITLLEDWGQVSKVKNPLATIALSAGRGLLDGIIEMGTQDMLIRVRAEFGAKPISEVCPAIAVGDRSQVRIESQGDRATALLPIEAWGAQTSVVAELQNGDSGWQVVAMDFEPAITEIKAHIESQYASGAK